MSKKPTTKPTSGAGAEANTAPTDGDGRTHPIATNMSEESQLTASAGAFTRTNYGRRDSTSSMYANPDTDPDYQKYPVVQDPKCQQTAASSKNAAK